jgi:selT/selW/selH-like putative selenoprotein
MPKQPRVEIEYCTQCRWLLRAAWMAQELLTTLGEVALQPGRGGVFEVRVDGETILVACCAGAFSRGQGTEATGTGLCGTGPISRAHGPCGALMLDL